MALDIGDNDRGIVSFGANTAAGDDLEEANGIAPRDKWILLGKHGDE
jgi:hypothetical protein